jgi:hypothetical protein
MPHKDDSVAAGMLATQELFEFLVNELRSFSTELAQIKAAVNDLKEDNATLLKLVRDGNGTPSLLRRVDRLEQGHKVSVESTRGKWQATVQALVSVTAIIVAVIALLA